jgi:hypothetical protein
MPRQAKRTAAAVLFTVFALGLGGRCMAQGLDARHFGGPLRLDARPFSEPHFNEPQLHSGPSPIDPTLNIPPSGPLSSLDEQKLESYRTNLQNRMEALRLYGRNTTPGGAMEMNRLQGEVGRINDALQGR